MWWHRLRLHSVRHEVRSIDPWRYWAYECKTCDYIWLH